MARNRFALVADGPSLPDVLVPWLAKHLESAPTHCAPDAFLDCLEADESSLVILAAAKDADTAWVQRWVQDCTLRQRRAVLLLVESEEVARRQRLNHLDPYVAGRFAWPSQAPALLNHIKRHLPRGEFPAETEPDLPERIRRRLLAQTPSLESMAEAVAIAAANDVNGLLMGETGTGKTYLARLIHDHSPRHNERLLIVPCGALSANLIGSELFGHVKGAFTGADRDKAGKFEAVGAGTLLLDEIDALPLEQQASLLRVLETGEYEPVGSHRTQVCKARVLAASNWDLEAAVLTGRFRQDLFYRLSVVSLHLPPLRQRVGDIGPLTREMAARFNSKFHKELFRIHPDVLASLEVFPWPGNIRQLENVVQQAVLLSTGPELLRAHLPTVVLQEALAPVDRKPVPGKSLMDTRQGAEFALIQQALIKNNFSRTKAAAALGVSRVTLYLKMKKYGLMDKPLLSPWERGSGQPPGGTFFAK